MSTLFGLTYWPGDSPYSHPLLRQANGLARKIQKSQYKFDVTLVNMTESLGQFQAPVNDQEYSLSQMRDTAVELIDLADSLMKQHQRLVAYRAQFMNQADTLENTIDAMRERFRDDHIQRLRSNECGLDQGLVYVNLLTNLEKIGDYCFNIAEAVAGKK